MTGETVTIVLPLPPRVLSPNHMVGSRRGRFAKAAAARKYREIAREATLATGVESGPWEHATIQATFYHATRRRRDDVNALASLKPAYDGIVDAGLIEDDDSKHLTTLPAGFGLDKTCPRVELKIGWIACRDGSTNG